MEQRVVKTAEGVTIAMQCTIEARIITRGDRCPFICYLRIIITANICTQEEIQIGATHHATLIGLAVILVGAHSCTDV